MNDEKLNKIVEKFELLYNINSYSPLFITIAYKKFLDENIDEALAIIEEGLKNFPDHPTALLLKSKIFVKKGNYHQALQLIRKATNLINLPATFNHYLTELELINKQLEEKSFAQLSDSYSSTEIKDQIFPQPETELKVSTESQTTKVSTSIDQNFVDDIFIVSETLAKIYFNQKEYKEAIRIYEKLKIKHPEKSEYYDSKISEIKALLEN